MGKSLGITAFVLLLISLPIPVVGNYVSLLAILILAGAAFQGERQWVWVTDLLAWVKMFLLSPTWHLMMFGGGYMRGMQREMEGLGTMDSVAREGMESSTRGMEGINGLVLFITIIILAAPIAILVWRSRNPAISISGASDA